MPSLSWSESDDANSDLEDSDKDSDSGDELEPACASEQSAEKPQAHTDNNDEDNQTFMGKLYTDISMDFYVSNVKTNATVSVLTKS